MRAAPKHLAVAQMSYFNQVYITHSETLEQSNRLGFYYPYRKCDTPRPRVTQFPGGVNEPPLSTLTAFTMTHSADRIFRNIFRGNGRPILCAGCTDLNRVGNLLGVLFVSPRKG